jgi:hypothetical protein
VTGRAPLIARLPLLVWILGLMSLVVGAVVVLAALVDGWGIALAVAALVATTTALALVIRDAVAHEQDDPPARDAGLRRPAAMLALVAVVMLAVSVVAASDDQTATATAPAGTSEAVQTVRDFLTAALVASDGESACAYLTPAEQLRAGAATGDGAACRVAFDAWYPPLTAGEPSTTEQVRDLPARAAPRGRAVRVTTGRGGAAHSFVLVPATPAESQAFDAPAAAWRISAGASALLAERTAAHPRPQRSIPPGA